MTDTHAVRLMANDERALARHHERLDTLRAEVVRQTHRRDLELAALNHAILRQGRSEQVRLVVRELCAPLLNPARTGGLPAHEVLEAALAWVAGTLACQELDESAGLKVRRLGRRMAEETIVF